MAYETPMIVAFGPFWSAALCGFVVVIGGVVHITPAGERYLETLPN